VLTVTPKPAKISTSQTICSGENFTWNENNTTYNASGTYLVAKDGCTADQELVLTVTSQPAKISTYQTICSGESYTWSENNMTYNTSGTYLVAKDGCTADQELVLTVTSKPVKISTYQTICSGESYTWSENNMTYNTSGTYLLTKDGCTADQELVLIVTPLLTSAVIHNSLFPENCLDEKNGAFSIEITGGSAPYELSLDNFNGIYRQISGTEYTYENLPAGLHKVYIKDANNCTNQLEIQIPNGVKINPIAEINYECLNNLSVNSVTVTIDQSITNPADIDYTLDENPSGYQDSNVFTNVPSGNHTITARHSNGCTQTTKSFIIDQINPLELSLNNGELNEIVASASGGSGNYQYTFNTESSATANKLIIYKSGTYIVTVTDKNGCSASISKYFDYIDISIPNYFTPDGDGINDEWGPDSSLQYQNLTFTIFDRYGRMINKFSNGQKWDGKYNGAELTSGDYWYVLKLNDPKDAREFVGHFTLYR
ncbi:T9SS type B sorting domain-containing protein, partial [Flavobacterium daemonense]|uniref:T9SS type B sorting domain-containing protein n=1 Tax=Flavobacterium daemonense TaxID=1393049 RepID=UPI0011863B9E